MVCYPFPIGDLICSCMCFFGVRGEGNDIMGNPGHNAGLRSNSTSGTAEHSFGEGANLGDPGECSRIPAPKNIGIKALITENHFG